MSQDTPKDLPPAAQRALAEAAERRKKAEAEAAKKAKEDAKQAAEAPAEEAPAEAPAEDSSSATPTPAPRRFTPVARPEPKKPERKKKEEKPARGAEKPDKRRGGKLSVKKALNEDEGRRARSLAALKRAREKERRLQGGGSSKPREKQVRDVIVPEAITVGELAKRMGEKGADLVKELFNLDMMVTVNQTIDQDTAELLVEEFGHRIERVSESDVDIDTSVDVDPEDTLQPRPPVVAIMGHVDHGKTSLLDALRGTDVVKGEAGGITQHIGAYQITTKDKQKITVLDTPGHEAFTEMRARGANVTDIVVLVVAADDGIMPQTIEAINHTKSAGVPMIVAINKIDKPEANAQKVRERLLEHEVIVEAMSGDVQDVEVSAKKGTGLDNLIEKILLQAELLELKARPDRDAEATVIEAKLDKGKGPLATVLVTRGTLKRGDTFVVGTESGRVRAMIDDKGKQIKEAGPSTPVEVLGLGGVPMAGDMLAVVLRRAVRCRVPPGPACPRPRRTGRRRAWVWFHRIGGTPNVFESGARPCARRNDRWFDVPVILLQGTPRCSATIRSCASMVNGLGSFRPIEISPIGISARLISISWTVLITVPQVPSNSGSTSLASTPR